MFRHLVCGLLLALCAAPSIAQTSPEIQELLAKAQHASRVSRYDEAIDLLKKAVKKQPDCSECMTQLAEAYGANRSWSDAQKTADKLLANAKTPVEQMRAHNLKGLLFSRQANEKPDKHADAIREYQAAEAIVHSPGLAFNIGVELESMNRDQEAAVELKKVVDDPAASEKLKSDARRYIEDPRRARQVFLPDFTVVTADGRTLTAESLRGKVVLLDFWATWCGPCRASLPDVRSTYKKFHGENFELISVSVDSDATKWKEFIGKEHMEWTQVLDDHGKLANLFGAHSIPRYFVVDPDGIIHKMVVGEGNYESMVVHEEISKALKNSRRSGGGL